MVWREEYKKKLVSAEAAVRVVKSGDRVSFTTGNEPLALGMALAARKDELRDVELFAPPPGSDFCWYDRGWEDSIFVPSLRDKPRNYTGPNTFLEVKDERDFG